MIREILNTKTDRESQRISQFLPKNCLAVAGILSILSDWKPCIIFLARLELLQINVQFRKSMPRNFKTFYFWIQ